MICCQNGEVRKASVVGALVIILLGFWVITLEYQVCCVTPVIRARGMRSGEETI